MILEKHFLRAVVSTLLTLLEDMSARDLPLQLYSNSVVVGVSLGIRNVNFSR